MKLRTFEWTDQEQAVRGDMARRVAQGAALLDVHMPGWEAKINIPTLDMGHIADCIVGQLDDGEVGRGLPGSVTRFWIEDYDYLMYPTELGLELGREEKETDIGNLTLYAFLRDFWIYEVEKRRTNNWTKAG